MPIQKGWITHSAAQRVDGNMDWLKLFDEEGVQFVILDRDGDGDLLALLRSRPGWVIDFETSEAVVFARSVPASSEDTWTSDTAQLTT